MSDELIEAMEPQIQELPLSKMRCPFSVALKFMKDGHRTSRATYPAGMYLWELPHANVPMEWIKDPILKRIAEENGGAVECLASIRVRNPDGTVQTGWAPSQADLMAEDWLIVLDEEVMITVTR